MTPRIVVTGAAVASPAGCSLPDLFDAIREGAPAIGEIAGFEPEAFPSRLGAETKERGGRRATPSAVDRKELFLAETLGRIAGCPAFRRRDPADRMLHLGLGLDYFDLEGYAESAAAAARDWQPYSRNTLTMARELARRHDMSGELSVNVTACVASSQALGLAFRRLKMLPPGQLAVAGGADSMLNPLHYMGFHKLGALSSWTGSPEGACRPFDRDRCGLVLGEGAALYLLEQASDADPGAALAEIAGYASTMDAYMVTDPDPSGAPLAAAALRALADARLAPADVDCVHLHGTGTVKNELAEIAAMRRIYPETYGDIPVYSMKGQVGHLIAGCGAMEMAGVLFSIATQSVPPTVNFRDPDPDVPLRVVSGKPLPMAIRNVLKLNAAFGGQNTALVVKRYEP